MPEPGLWFDIAVCIYVGPLIGPGVFLGVFLDVAYAWDLVNPGPVSPDTFSGGGDDPPDPARGLYRDTLTRERFIDTLTTRLAAGSTGT